MEHSITCDGDLGIRQISEIYSKITAALESNTAIVVDVSVGARPDISFIQLIESARVRARLDGKSIALAAPAEGLLFDVLTRSGFIASDRPQDAAFWLHKANAQ